MKRKKNQAERLQAIETYFHFCDGTEKFLMYIGYIVVNNRPYSIYIDRETKELHIYRVKMKRKRNVLLEIDDEDELIMVEKSVLNLLNT